MSGNQPRCNRTPTAILFGPLFCFVSHCGFPALPPLASVCYITCLTLQFERVEIHYHVYIQVFVAKRGVLTSVDLANCWSLFEECHPSSAALGSWRPKATQQPPNGDWSVASKLLMVLNGRFIRKQREAGLCRVLKLSRRVLHSLVLSVFHGAWQ